MLSPELLVVYKVLKGLYQAPPKHFSMMVLLTQDISLSILHLFDQTLRLVSILFRIRYGVPRTVQIKISWSIHIKNHQKRSK